MLEEKHRGSSRVMLRYSEISQNRDIIFAVCLRSVPLFKGNNTVRKIYFYGLDISFLGRGILTGVVQKECSFRSVQSQLQACRNTAAPLFKCSWRPAQIQLILCTNAAAGLHKCGCRFVRIQLQACGQREQKCSSCEI